MQTSINGLNLIKKWEGCFLKAYHGGADRPGLLTIGYGHTTAAGAPTVTAGMSITQSEADQILVNDLHKVEQAVNLLVKVDLNQNQFDTLVSFTFNLGESNLRNSTLLRELNEGNYGAVPVELMKWTHSNGVYVQGLANRRSEEAKLWNTPVVVSTPKTPAEVPAPEHIGLGATIVGAAVAVWQTSIAYWPLIAAGVVVAAIIWAEIRRNRNSTKVN